MSNSSGSSSTPRIQVFRPTMDEFKNFSKYIQKIESTGAHKAGLAKIIPPEGWCPRKKGYDDIELTIPAPISQVVTGRQGLYQQINIQQKAMTVKEFKKLAESSKYKTPTHFDYEDLERKYWKNITYNSPIYGADVSGSLYDQGVNEFNIQHLNTILDMVKEDYEIQIEGVNTAYLYFGMWKTTFAWHTEDMDLYSINYLHFGAPKSWYVVPPEHGRRLERLANGFFHGSAQSCPAFLRHKMTIISPHILKQYSIPCSKITQDPGEFMFTFPFGYHSGFNHGFNCAESTNFALERWIEYGKRTISCTCRNDCVKICMDVFVRKFQPERYELWKAGKDIGIHPEEPNRHYAAPPPRKFELALAQQREEKKKKMAQKLKRHPISKLEKTENRSRSMGRVFPYKSDDEETELYDVNEIISQKQQRKRSKKDDDLSQKRDDEGVEDNEMKNCDMKDDAVESDLEMSVENDPDEKNLSSLIPEVVDSPPQLTPFWDPEGEKMKYGAENEECFDDVITSDIQTPKKEPKMAFEDYPLLKQAISSGAMTIMCVNPVPGQLKLPNTIPSNIPEYTEKGSPNAKEIYNSKSTKSPNFSNKIINQHWRCEPGNDGLKIKLIQPKKINQNPSSTPTPVSISINALQHKEHNSPSATSDYHILPDVKAQFSVKKGSPCVEKSPPPPCMEKGPPPCVEKNPPFMEGAGLLSPSEKKNAPPSGAEENTQKHNESNTKENASEDALGVKNTKVKRANRFGESWAVPVSDLWQQQEFNFEAECAYNEKLASIPPHCAICVIFTPMYNTNSFPTEPSDVPSNSVVRMPAFCYGNALNSECLIDTSSLLRRDGTAPLLICSKCKVCVHATCYGISMLPIGEWMCTRCSKQAINSECCLCVMRGGALKPTSDGHWAHVICAILIPETYFENTFTKQPVNVSKISPDRQKLKCKYCLKSSSRKDLKGFCVQCLSGRCYHPYHVTCGYMAGVRFEANNWPEPIHMICTKHAAARRRPPKRELTNVTIGEKVIAKHKNKRYYWANVKNKYRKDYYSILFEDNSHSSNTLPEDIVSRNVELQGPPQINEKVQVKWTDDKIYNGIFKGSQSIELYVIEFDDESIMHQERKQIYAADEELPKEVKSRLSHSSERRAHDFEAETTDGKRIRIINHKYS